VVQAEMVLTEFAVDSLLVAQGSISLMGKCRWDFNESDASENQAGRKP